MDFETRYANIRDEILEKYGKNKITAYEAKRELDKARTAVCGIRCSRKEKANESRS